MKIIIRSLLIGFALSLVLSGCGGGGSDDSDDEDPDINRACYDTFDIGVSEIIAGILEAGDCQIYELVPAFVGLPFEDIFVDQYILSNTYPGLVTISMRSDTIDSYLYLIDEPSTCAPNCNSSILLGEDDDGGGGTFGRDARISLNLGAGTYLVFVTTFLPEAGSYTLEVTSDNILYEPPEARISFPPSASFTSGSEVTVVGTAADEDEIAAVEVNGIAVTTLDNYANWQVRVPLATGVNDLIVSTTDILSNTRFNAAQVSITRGNSGDSFPDASNALTDFVRDMVVDGANNRLLISDITLNSIVAVDMDTGVRSIFSGQGIPDDVNPFGGVRGIGLDADNNRLLVASETDTSLFAVDLTTGARTVITNDSAPGSVIGVVDIAMDSSNNRVLGLEHIYQSAVYEIQLPGGASSIFSNATIPDTNFPFSPSFGIINDPANGRALLTDNDIGAIFTVSLVDGSRTILSGPGIPDSANPLNFPVYLDLDSNADRILVTDLSNGAVVAVDSTTGARSILTSGTFPDAVNPLVQPVSVAVDNDSNRIFVTDRILEAVLEIEPSSGERVILSR